MIANYRNDYTGELAAPHRLGVNAEGMPIYQGQAGWTPVDKDGSPVEVDADADGNWTVRDANAYWLVRCECGELTGQPCNASIHKSDALLVEVIPEHLRASHEAARNRGCYPHNGALRLRVTPACADALEVSEGDWLQVISP